MCLIFGTYLMFDNKRLVKKLMASDKASKDIIGIYKEDSRNEVLFWRIMIILFGICSFAYGIHLILL